MIYSWKKIIRNSLPLLSVAITIEILAGQILKSNAEFLYLMPIFLISFPVINSVSGNIGSVLGARLASGLHVGYIKLSIKDKKMHDNLFTALFIGVITYTLLAIVIYFIAIFVGFEMTISLIKFAGIVLVSGIILISLVSAVSVLTAFISFKRGLDPDDMVAPVVTTVGDVMGILFLFLIIGIFGV